MANVFWQGTATAVAQVGTFQITAYDAATTYKITIGGEVVSVVGNTDVNTTASDLQVALEASTHPYFSNITWTVATDTVTATAGTAGVPFTAASSVSGGTGTIGAYSATTASSGPNDWSTAENWSGGAVPVNSDDVIIENNSVNIAWGLAQSGVTLTSLIIKKSFTGRIGLKENVFATSANGATASSVDVEYRDTYLNIKATDCQIGENNKASSSTGSGLIKLDLDSAVSTCTIFGSAASVETNKPAIQLLANNSSTKIYVRKATGGVGIAVAAPFETSTIASVDISDTMVSNGVHLGSGVTITTWSQKNGTNFIEAAATITTIDCLGGTLTLEGDYTVTTVNVSDGGVLKDNHIKTSGNAITTLNVNRDGEVDTLGSSEPRTFATVNFFNGGRFIADADILTITTQKFPTGVYTLTTA